MGSSCTHLDNRQQANTAFLAKPVATFIETLLPVEAPAARQAPIIKTATMIFTNHWKGAAGDKIPVPAHNGFNLIARTCTK